MNDMLRPGDVIVRKVANGYTVTVLYGHGMEVAVYVAADVDALPDVLKQAVVSGSVSGR